MKTILIKIICGFALLCTAGSTLAQDTFIWNWNWVSDSGDTRNGSGSFTTTTNQNKDFSYTILSITGQIEGTAIAGLLWANPEIFANPALNNGYYTDPGGVYFNDINQNQYLLTEQQETINVTPAGADSFDDTGIFSVTVPDLIAPVPEPSTLALAGLGGLAMLWQFRQRK